MSVAQNNQEMYKFNMGETAQQLVRAGGEPSTLARIGGWLAERMLQIDILARGKEKAALLPELYVLDKEAVHGMYMNGCDSTTFILTKLSKFPHAKALLLQSVFLKDDEGRKKLAGYAEVFAYRDGQVELVAHDAAIVDVNTTSAKNAAKIGVEV